MFEFKLQELFCTLGIGAYTGLFILYIFCFFIKNPSAIARLVFGSESDHSKTGMIIIALILLYGFGALMQDALGPNDAGVIEFSNFSKIKRGEVLFKTKEGKELSGLGYTVFSTDTTAIHATNVALGENFFEYPECKNQDLSTKWYITNSNINKLDFGNKDEPHRNNLWALTDRLYYISKNWCVLKSSTANEELASIQQRMDFAKSIGVISFYVAIILFILLLISLFTITSKRNRFWMNLILLSIVFGIYCICLTAYPIEIKNFNRRVYGYYADNLNFENKEAAKLKVLEPTIPSYEAKINTNKISINISNNIIAPNKVPIRRHHNKHHIKRRHSKHRR